MKRVLVTGARGFVGQHLVRDLADQGMAVIGIDRSTTKTSDTPSNITYETVDLCDPAAVAAIDFREFDSVVHLAALAAVRPSFAAPMEYLVTNMGMEVNVFEAALKQKASPRFLVVSSGALYDPSAALPLSETTRIVPSSPYAVSKVGQEQLAQYYSLRGFECIVARPFNHIGPGQSLGFIVPDLTKQVVDVAAGLRPTVIAGNLDAKRDYTDVRDVVRAYRLLLERGKTGATYNICSGKAVSGTELFALINAAAGTTATFSQDPDQERPSDSPELYGDHAKLTNDTGWQPQIPLATTIADCVADWRSRP